MCKGQWTTQLLWKITQDVKSCQEEQRRMSLLFLPTSSKLMFLWSRVKLQYFQTWYSVSFYHMHVMVCHWCNIHLYYGVYSNEEYILLNWLVRLEKLFITLSLTAESIFVQFIRFSNHTDILPCSDWILQSDYNFILNRSSLTFRFC